MGKQTSITYWFPFGLRMSYSGSPKTRWEWLKCTWIGYVGMWQLLFYAIRAGIRSGEEASNAK